MSSDDPAEPTQLTLLTRPTQPATRLTRLTPPTRPADPAEKPRCVAFPKRNAGSLLRPLSGPRSWTLANVFLANASGRPRNGVRKVDSKSGPEIRASGALFCGSLGRFSVVRWPPDLGLRDLRKYKPTRPTRPTCLTRLTRPTRPTPGRPGRPG